VFDLDVKYIGDDMKVTVYDEDLTASDMVRNIPSLLESQYSF